MEKKELDKTTKILLIIGFIVVLILLFKLAPGFNKELYLHNMMFSSS